MSESTIKFTDVTLLFCMVNPKLRNVAKKTSEILRYKYRSSKLINSLINYYRSEEPTTINDLNLILDGNNVTGDRKSEILDYYSKIDNMSDLGISQVKLQYKQLISSIILDRASNESNPSKAIEFIASQSLDFTDNVKISSKIKKYDLKHIDIDKVLEEFGTPIKSSIDSINNCSVIGGYIPHQLVCVVAPPSTGKSLFLMNEMVQFLNDGLKVCYIALGDLTEHDFITRLPAINSGITINEAIKNAKIHWEEFKNNLGSRFDNFEVYYIDANTTSSDELMSYIKDEELDKKFDVFFVDYDTNFKSDNDMYLKGDEIYNNLVNLAKRVKLVFIASQPKTAVYNNEIIYMNDAAESGRKPQIVDLMITISRNPDAKTKCGYINLAKCRRGMVSTAFNYMLTQSGKFTPITFQHYKALENDDKVRDIPGQAIVKSDVINKTNSVSSEIDKLMSELQ